MRSGGLLVLCGGFPREPDAGSWEEVSSLPGPRSLLEALFLDLCGNSLNDMPQTEDDASGSIDGDWQTRAITVARNGTGFHQIERKCIGTSAHPLREIVDTFGLPGLELHWEYHLALAGQLGHTAFRHDRLTVQFASSEARQTFEEIWRRIFAITPEFESE